MTAREKKAVEIVRSRYALKYPWSDEELMREASQETGIILEAMQWQAEQCEKVVRTKMFTKPESTLQAIDIINAGTEEATQ